MTIAVVTGRRKVMAATLGLLGGCAVPPPAPCAPPPAGPSGWVIDHGRHTDIALRAEDLSGPVGDLRAWFPGAATLAFGFGKRSFVLAEAGAAAEYLLGPLPGRGVIEVKGRTALPGEAWAGRAIALPLPPGGLAALLAFLADSIAPSGTPLVLRGSLFLDASRGYSPLFTCNTWTAEALRRAGLPVSADGVVLAGALLGQLRPLGCAA